LANNLGLTLSRLGRHAEAVGFFRQALAVRPSFTAARFNLALALYRAGDHDRALEHLRRVTAEDPAFPDLQSTVRVIEKAQHSEARP
jgi:tetratricopeptide (TPR) repeat protein